MIFGYVFLLLFSLLTFGGVAPGAAAAIEGFIFTLFFLYLLRGAREGRKGSDCQRGYRGFAERKSKRGTQAQAGISRGTSPGDIKVSSSARNR